MRVTHFFFALDVDPTARDAGEGGVSDLLPFAVLCEISSRVHVPSLHKSSSIAKLARRQTNAVKFATKVCFDGSEVIS